MVASAVPGEGKTFTSVNLAMSLAAERDLSVLLVDADVAKPHISSVLGLGKEPGLLDCIQNESLDVESLIVETDVERLSVLPAGPVTEAATELLASARMADIVRALGRADPNRIVVFDSPPLLLTSESRVLSTIVGQIVLVVTAGETPQQAVLGALSHIGEGKTIGLVLNQSVGDTGAQYQYPGYGSYGESSTLAEARDSQQKLKE
jgi:exopolysaccharide/PEP-CTERM locus tyrosine autokinase